MASSDNSSYNVNKYVASTALLIKFYFTYSTDSFLLWRWWKLTQEICVVCTLIVHKFSRQEWSVRSETILSVLISNIPFFFAFFDRSRRTTIDVHTQFFKATSLFWLQQQWPVARGPRILLDLVSTHFLARLVMFHLLSSVYIPACLFPWRARASWKTEGRTALSWDLKTATTKLIWAQQRHAALVKTTHLL